jgi:hypothetical protein
MISFRSFKKIWPAEKIQKKVVSVTCWFKFIIEIGPTYNERSVSAAALLAFVFTPFSCSSKTKPDIPTHRK